MTSQLVHHSPPTSFAALSLSLALVLALAVRADEPKKEPVPAPVPVPVPAPEAAKEAAPRLGELSVREKKFVETLTGATLSGRWRLVHDGKLGEEKEDTYSVRSVVKVTTTHWIVNARVQYGQKDVTLPVPVRLAWAEGVPVI